MQYHVYPIYITAIIAKCTRVMIFDQFDRLFGRKPLSLPTWKHQTCENVINYGTPKMKTSLQILIIQLFHISIGDLILLY